MSILDVEHQPRAHRVLQRALACERMPHAYLFAGPEGVGKEMLAHALARTLLCASPEKKKGTFNLLSGDGDEKVECPLFLDACGGCQECRLVGASTHPDLFLIHRQLNKQHPDAAVRRRKALYLGVDVIRHFVIDRAGTCPARGRAKVFIIREAERLNESAQNSLLKTLEEPPASTFIILLTNALDRMLPTTRSRCQQVVFQSLPIDYVADRLASLRADSDPTELTYAARHAGGSLGAALRQIDDGLYAIKRNWGDRLAELAAERQETPPNQWAKPFLDDAKTLGRCVAERDPDVSDTDATRAGLQTLLAAMADFYVDALRKAGGADLSPVNADQLAVVDRLATTHDPAALVVALNRLSEADMNLARNAHVELTLEAMFIHLARAAGRSAPSPSPRE